MINIVMNLKYMYMWNLMILNNIFECNFPNTFVGRMHGCRWESQDICVVSLSRKHLEIMNTDSEFQM